MIFLLLFVVVPLVIVLINAFLGDEGKLTFDNFIEFFSDKGGGMTVLGNSLIIGLVTTLICLVIGYPVAYFLAKVPCEQQSVRIAVYIADVGKFLIRTLSTKAIL